jgi:hypothetical protein
MRFRSQRPTTPGGFELRRRAPLWALACALLGACTVPVPFADDWLFTTELPALPRANDCKRCHLDVYREWSESGHASAWTSRDFRQLTVDHAAGACLECHAPAPLGSDGDVRLRADHREEGVTCISCHLSAEPGAKPLTMRGPHERISPVDAHPVAPDPLFLKAELCGTCHAGVLEEWRESPQPADAERKVCQECHMPGVRRTIESYDPAKPYSAVLVALSGDVDGRRHLFAVPEQPWEDIDVELHTRPEGGLRVEVANRLPHAIPTGTYGRREARLRIVSGDVVQTRTLRADLDDVIAAGTTRSFDFPGPIAADATVVLERRDPGSGSFVRIAPAPPSDGSETP